MKTILYLQTSISDREICQNIDIKKIIPSSKATIPHIHSNTFQLNQNNGIKFKHYLNRFTNHADEFTFENRKEIIFPSVSFQGDRHTILMMKT